MQFVKTFRAELRANSLVVFKVTLALVSTLVALLAIFGLKDWVETSALAHAAQHLMIFSGGIGMGVAIVTKSSKESE